MPEDQSARSPPDTYATTTGPLVFISHDSRDAELAEAFSKLFKSVSAGMIKTFRSSDKKGTDGIEFGDEWYNRLMAKLEVTTDVVCLFTERSLERPWILFEAGVAKGKLNTPVIGVALGVPLNRIGTGPFYQFHNMEDSEADLTKLVNQLARRVPNLELDADVVKAQVQAFKAAETSIVQKSVAAAAGKKAAPANAEDSAVAKLVEEMKSLPSRVAERLAEELGSPRRRKRLRPHPMMFRDLMDLSEPGDLAAIPIAASMLREDLPWLYELAMEMYRAARSGDADCIERAIDHLQHSLRLISHGPWVDFGDRDMQIIVMEFSKVLDEMLGSALERLRGSDAKKVPHRKRLTKTARKAE